MAHHKRRKRRRAGTKGCCAMCTSATHRGGLRNQRFDTLQEQRAGEAPDPGVAYSRYYDNLRLDSVPDNVRTQ